MAMLDLVCEVSQFIVSVGCFEVAPEGTVNNVNCPGSVLYPISVALTRVRQLKN